MINPSRIIRAVAILAPVIVPAACAVSTDPAQLIALVKIVGLVAPLALVAHTVIGALRTA